MQNVKSILRLCVSMSLFSSSFLCSQAQAEDTKTLIERFVVIGDSMSDTGRQFQQFHGVIPSQENYWEGRYTDGFVWADYMAQSLNTTVYDNNAVVNLSVSGTTAYPYPEAVRNDLWKGIFSFIKSLKKAPLGFLYDMRGLIDEFGKDFEYKPTDLFIINMGGNDVLWVAEEVDRSLSLKQVAYNAATKIGENLDYLISKGAKNILVMGLPDLNLTPEFNKKLTRGEQSAYFNKMLRDKVESLKSPLYNIEFMDMDGMMRNIIGKYKEFGFSNATGQVTTKSFERTAVCVKPALLCTYMDFSVNSQGQSSHVFWDHVHPTTRTHSIIWELLKKNYIEPKYEVKTKNAKCNYVELKNQSAMIVKANFDGDTNTCGTTPSSILTPGDVTLLSVPDGSELAFEAMSVDASDGSNARVPVSNKTNIEYRANEAGLPILIPTFQRVTCSGAGAINFECK